MYSRNHQMNMENTNGLRKGGWTHQEDELLKACINKYGEGKWHLVPHRAGLNRCRRSCRLRWLNYLNPKINKERFAEDEVDMMLRLHKLLGNRWSLIAGRLPGRTANDVKNYWHTHLSKKMKEEKKEKEKEKPKETIKKAHHHEVIKPKPQTLSSNSQWLKGKHKIASDDASTSLVRPTNEEASVHRECNNNMLSIGGGDSTTLGDAPLSSMWWESLWNLENQLQVENEIIDPNSLISNQEENSLLEFQKDFGFTEDSIAIWEFNLCDVDYGLDL